MAADDAETVWTIFRRYLELGSIGALMDDLDRQAIRTRQRRGANDRVREAALTFKQVLDAAAHFGGEEVIAL